MAGKLHKLTLPTLLGSHTRAFSDGAQDGGKIEEMALQLAEVTGESTGDITVKLDELSKIIPDLGAVHLGFPSVQPKTLLRLALNLDEVFQRIFRLKTMLPACDILFMVCKRPTLVIDDDLQLVHTTLQDLKNKGYSSDMIEAIAEDFPGLLVKVPPSSSL
ncbi:hypothetical protein CYMTET_44226 [Cymbomonas tetramitiformis]|uniref:Uncharacterized protein n=1 Tax=Cymbomonas tetramitiformis TaxID=36881 RepID=A0AAE0EZ89_9CHLO|nr:hypothetical protein CYMTET_44226 [Cymbomonas tetramitiformis]